MYEAAKEADERPEGEDSGSRTGLAHMDGTGRGPVLLVHREQEVRPAPKTAKRIIKRDGQRVWPEEGPEKKYTEDELREKLSIAYSVESRAGHRAEHLEMECIGTIATANPVRYKRLYEDSDGNIWHQTMFLIDGVLVTDTEYIFGRKDEKRVCG